MSESPQERTARLLATLRAPRKLDRIDVTYSLVFRKEPDRSGYDWHLAIPYWMTQEQGRSVALALRDAARASGLDVEVIQQATVTDVIA